MPVLKVFQADPLVNDLVPDPKVLRRRHLIQEQSMINDALQGSTSRLRPEFKVASKNTLPAFLEQPDSAFLYISCHGYTCTVGTSTGNFLLIENDHGGAYALDQGSVLNWIGVAAKCQLKVVFLSACVSLEFANAFVEAGVPHVVCYTGAGDDRAAMLFATTFYRALANETETTVQTAFDLAKVRVQTSLEMLQSGLKPDEEAKNFVLLPESGNHNVSPFEGQDVPATMAEQEKLSQDLASPVPKCFVGREMDMYRVMAAFIQHNASLVKLKGPCGVGKVTLAHAVSHYMTQRQMWGELVIWLPLAEDVNANVGDKELMMALRSMMSFLETSVVSNEDLLTYAQYKQFRDALLQKLGKQKLLLVIKTSKLGDKTLSKLKVLVKDILERTTDIKFLVVQTSDAIDFDQWEAEFAIEPLAFPSTLSLFSQQCGHCISNVDIHWDYRTLTKKYESLSTSSLTRKLLGDGIPAKIIFAAKNISGAEYRKLLDPVASITEDDFKNLLQKLNEYQTIRCSQSEVKDTFGPILQAEGKVYRKVASAFIARAPKGERIVTVIDGKQDSENVVKDETSWLVCGKVAGEYYILTDEEFSSCYDRNSAKNIDANSPGIPDHVHRLLRKKQPMFQEYTPTRQVLAHQVTSRDMDWFRERCTASRDDDQEGAAFFQAPWGGRQRVQEGDYLVMECRKGGGKDEIYRIEESIFMDTYKPVQVGHLEGLSSPRSNTSIISQFFVREKFGLFLLKFGRAYRKKASAFIARAPKGERIVTVIDGKQDSENVVKDETSWLVCGKVAGEYYILTDEEFSNCYDRDSAKNIDANSPGIPDHVRRLLRKTQPMFREYTPTRQVLPHQVTSRDMDWFRECYASSTDDDQQGAAFFQAPWGGRQRVQEGDYLVMERRKGGGKDEIYRIEESIFLESYEAVERTHADVAVIDDGTYDHVVIPPKRQNQHDKKAKRQEKQEQWKNKTKKHSSNGDPSSHRLQRHRSSRRTSDVDTGNEDDSEDSASTHPGAIPIAGIGHSRAIRRTLSQEDDELAQAEQPLSSSAGGTTIDTPSSMVVEAKLVVDDESLLSPEELEKMECRIRERIQKEELVGRQQVVLAQAEVIVQDLANDETRGRMRTEMGCRCLGARRKCAIVCITVALLVVGIAIGAGLLATGNHAKVIDASLFDDIEMSGYFPELHRYDPTSGEFPVESGRWENDGQSGLELQIINSLEDNWRPFLIEAVQNWNDGTPIDALTLSIVDADYDLGCTGDDRGIQVCNGDYGPSGWRATAEILLSTGTPSYIAAASVRVNDYYLHTNAGQDDLIQYAFCHTLGNAFGLPNWWDESSPNRNLGNCMVDEFEHSFFEGNKRPDSSNFLFLGQLYGGVNVSTGELVSAEQLRRDAGYETTSPANTTDSTTLAPTATRRHHHQLRRLQQRQPDKERRRAQLQPSSPPLVSRVQEHIRKLDEDYQGRDSDSRSRKMTQNTLRQKRVLLQVNSHYEVHRIEQEMNRGDKGGFVTLEFYQMVVDK